MSSLRHGSRAHHEASGVMTPFVLLLAVLILCPLMLGEYWLGVAFLAALYASAASAWNIAGGFAGTSSFGQGLFYGIGGYATTLLFTDLGLSPWLGMLAGAGIAALVGAIIGWLGVRAGIGGLSFAVLTLAVAEVANLFVTSFDPFGASRGISIPPSGSPTWDMQFFAQSSWFAVGGALLVLTQLIAIGIHRSRVGYRLRAVRDNPLAAQAMGINLTGCRSSALAISGALTALAGAIFAQYSVFVNPSFFGPTLTIEVILFTLIGGMGTVWGPVLGAAILYPLGEWLRTQYGGSLPGLDILVYGLLVIACILVFPGGLIRVGAALVPKRANQKLKGPEDATPSTPLRGSSTEHEAQL